MTKHFNFVIIMICQSIILWWKLASIKTDKNFNCLDSYPYLLNTVSITYFVFNIIMYLV